MSYWTSDDEEEGEVIEDDQSKVKQKGSHIVFIGGK